MKIPPRFVWVSWCPECGDLVYSATDRKTLTRDGGFYCFMGHPQGVPAVIRRYALTEPAPRKRS